LSFQSGQFKDFSYSICDCAPHLHRRNASRGNNLVIEQGNGGEEDIPLRLIPLTLFGTITNNTANGEDKE
jgi:hypothetical protein